MKFETRNKSLQKNQAMIYFHKGLQRNSYIHNIQNMRVHEFATKHSPVFTSTFRSLRLLLVSGPKGYEPVQK